MAGARLVAICADVRDPGNAGTVIRCADAAGADGVVLAGSSVDAYNPKTVRASVGSLFHLPLAVEPSAEAAVRAAKDCRAHRAGRGRRRRGGALRRPAGRPHGLAVRQRGAGGCPPSSPRWPTTGSRSRSTGGPRASTSRPPPRSASTSPRDDSSDPPSAGRRQRRRIHGFGRLLVVPMPTRAAQAVVDALPDGVVMADAGRPGHRDLGRGGADARPASGLARAGRWTRCSRCATRTTTRG